jgi:hypothetical protein
VCCPDETQSTAGAIVRSSLSLDGELEAVAGAEGSLARRQFEADFATDIARLLQIEPQRVVIESVVSGSVVVIFDIMPDGQDVGIDVSTVETTFAEAGVSLPTLEVTTAGPVTVATPAALATDESGGTVDSSPSPPEVRLIANGALSIAPTTMCGLAVAAAVSIVLA